MYGNEIVRTTNIRFDNGNESYGGKKIQGPYGRESSNLSWPITLTVFETVLTKY